MTTKSTKQSDIKREWWQIDADGQVLGRMASKIAQLLIGKDKPYFVSHLDCGDYVVVTNIEKVEVTGKKAKQKMYYRHSGYPSGLKEINFEKLIQKKPEEVIKRAVSGMLPKNKLRASRMKRLRLFVGDTDTFEDKKPKNIE